MRTGKTGREQVARTHKRKCSKMGRIIPRSKRMRTVFRYYEEARGSAEMTKGQKEECQIGSGAGRKHQNRRENFAAA